ncbi:MAG: ATP-binding protein [Selenomonadaceae bacterium]|nr:ATP-binding protein [Selenomonadaceae bacterium]
MGIGERVKPKESADSKVKDGEEKPEEIFVPVEPKFSFDDIILPERVREQIMNAADYAKNSQKVFEECGLKNTHRLSKRIGINLYGEPGTGKTMAAHAIANHLKRKIIIVNYADIESKYVGETPKNIRKVFEAGKNTESIIFFDEADAILSRRVTNMSNATDVSVNQTRSVMLMLMNEYQDFIIFATNFISNFDPAFMRRISVHVKFELPDANGRELLWKKYVPKEMPTNLDSSEIALKYEGLSGSDISNAVLNAAFHAARSSLDNVPKEYVFQAVEEILESKKANKRNSDVEITKRIVSEDYVKEQLGK